MPLPNEHACRVRDPDQFVRFYRDNDKDPNEIWGVRENESHALQSYRYPTSRWSEREARNHCTAHEGDFEPAKDDEQNNRAGRGLGVSVKGPPMQLSAHPVWAIYEDPIHGQDDSGNAITLSPSRTLEQLQQMVAASFGADGAEDKKKSASSIEIYDGPAQAASREGLPIQVAGGVGVISIEGVMTRFIQGARMVTAMEAVEAAVRSAAGDRAIGSILLRINSPGGSVDGLAQLADTVKAAAGSKRVVAQIAGMGASAAYYVASQASEIRAERTNLVGSLGARLLVMDLSRLAKNEGVEVIPIDSAPEDRPFKSAGAPGTEITKAQRADFQRIVDAFAEDFRTAVMNGRNMSREQLDAVFDGRVWQAGKAVELGLVDQVATLRQTLSELRTESPGSGANRQTGATDPSGGGEEPDDQAAPPRPSATPRKAYYKRELDRRPAP